MNVVLKLIGFLLLIFFSVMIAAFLLTNNKKYLSLAKAVFKYMIYMVFILIPIGFALKYLHL
jgi:hypothetical protein